MSKPLYVRLGTGLIVLALGVCWVSVSAAQMGIPFNQRDDQYVLLGLKRSMASYETARADHERTLKLHEDGLASDAEVDAARRAFADAEVNYQQSLLAVVFEQQYVAVTGAVKYRDPGGGKRVRLEIENTSGASEELLQLAGVEDSLLQAMSPEVVHNVYVSLLNDDSAVIGQPYEAKVDALRYGKPASLDFELLQDLDAVTVNLVFGNGSQRAVKIFLQKDATVDRVLVQSEQFSQEAELGGSATFDLGLELFSGRSDTFRLEVVNLPQAINRYFFDPDSDARLRQIRFAESGRTRNAALRIFLPDRPTDEINAGEPITFFVLAIPEDRAVEMPELTAGRFDAEQVEELGVGFARLELVPRGVGALLVRAPQLFFSTQAGEPVEMTLELANDGTRRLDNVEVTAEPPLGWIERIDPPLLRSLDIGEERTVRLELQPPETVSVGKYEIRVRTTSFADEQLIEGEDKTVTVQVQAATSIAAPAILIAIILAFIIAVVILGVRLARR